jgi:hypothetical protein
VNCFDGRVGGLALSDGGTQVFVEVMMPAISEPRWR